MAAQVTKVEATPPETVEVFVYGTLKKGFPLHEWMNGSEFKGYDLLAGHTLIDLGPYPALVKVHGGMPGDFKTQGELYEMPYKTFEQLRRMEEAAGYKTLDVVTRKNVKAKTFIWQQLDNGIAQWESDGRASQVVVHLDDDVPF